MSNIMSKFNFGANNKTSKNNDEKINDETEKKIKKQCEKCKGVGLIKRTKKFICNNCNENKLFRCYLCENVQRGPYIECNICFGTGEVYFRKENKITNYTIC
tara:strand:- start:2186 stop:2491 length:306 start_codon:yes stop_codon:yes gene_type:complete